MEEKSLYYSFVLSSIIFLILGLFKEEIGFRVFGVAFSIITTIFVLDCFNIFGRRDRK
jgi:hypothetical protein